MHDAANRFYSGLLQVGQVDFGQKNNLQMHIFETCENQTPFLLWMDGELVAISFNLFQ
jgi:hypothetical protein